MSVNWKSPSWYMYITYLNKSDYVRMELFEIIQMRMQLYKHSAIWSKLVNHIPLNSNVIDINLKIMIQLLIYFMGNKFHYKLIYNLREYNNYISNYFITGAKNKN